MNVKQFLVTATVLTMLGGSTALADTASIQTQRQPVAAQQSDATPLPPLAANMPRTTNLLAAPQIDQTPKKLPLANFGQWDEAASEN